MDLDDFKTAFSNQVNARADADGIFSSEAFTAEAADRLNDVGETANLEAIEGFTGLVKRRRVAVDAYDLSNSDNSIALAVTLFDPEPGASLTNTAAKGALGALFEFLRSSVSEDFLREQEASRQAYAVAQDLHDRGREVSRYRLFLLTNRVAGNRVAKIPDDLVNLIPVEHHIWDLGRFKQIEESSQDHIPLDIDLSQYVPQGIPTLEIAARGGSMRTFLSAIPGAALAELYGRHGSRLLESNVRSFLSTRGKVNKGIRQTLTAEPERFLAYNNGITATATNVTLSETGNLLRVTDLQIVNGGQTTASLFYSRREKTDIEQAFVQMKLIEVSPGESLEMVPKISQYANSQNKVSDADFFSNSPFHRRMEQHSRKVLAPSLSGSRLQSTWFYERNRGQYQNEMAKLSPADRKREELVRPKSQVITKTEAAIFLMSWEQRPQTVSAGTQKNFAAFAQRITPEFDAHPEYFNERYYRELVAKALLYKQLRSAISKAEWYDKAFLANLTTYAIAKLAHDVAATAEVEFPFNRIWNEQQVPAPILEVGTAIARDVRTVLTSGTRSTSNPTEWAKKEECWTRVKDLRIEYSPEFWETMESKFDHAQAKKDAAKSQILVDQLEVYKKVYQAPKEEWEALVAFAKRHRTLTATESSLAGKMVKGGFLPSERQLDALVKFIRKNEERGFEDHILRN